MDQQQGNERRAGGLLCRTCGLVQTHERVFALAAFGKVAGLGRKAKVDMLISCKLLQFSFCLLQSILIFETNNPLMHKLDES